jgi:hypothetical protein
MRSPIICPSSAPTPRRPTRPRRLRRTRGPNRRPPNREARPPVYARRAPHTRRPAPRLSSHCRDRDRGHGRDRDRLTRHLGGHERDRFSCSAPRAPEPRLATLDTRGGRRRGGWPRYRRVQSRPQVGRRVEVRMRPAARARSLRPLRRRPRACHPTVATANAVRNATASALRARRLTMSATRIRAQPAVAGKRDSLGSLRAGPVPGHRHSLLGVSTPRAQQSLP